MKLTLTLCIPLLLLFVNCSSDDDQKSNNLPPSNFEVSVEDSSYTTAKITWSPSFDPEEGDVSYNIYLDGALAIENIEELFFAFEILEPQTQYEGSVIAVDDAQNERKVDFTLLTSGNSGPGSFELLEGESTNVDFTMQWSEAIDPENENVLYDIFLDDSLIVEAYPSTFYIIEGLLPRNNYTCKIIASDEQGNTSELEFSFDTQDGIYRNDIRLTSQGGVDSFGSEGWLEILGNLELGGIATSSNITDLSPLSSLVVIEDNLVISFVDDLEMIDFEHLKSVGRSISIKQNESLKYITGFNELQRITSNFLVQNNRNLEDVIGFENLETIGGELYWSSNFNLLNVQGFNTLNNVHALIIGGSTRLQSINAFNNLEEVDGAVGLGGSYELTELQALQSLRYAGRLDIGRMSIQNIDFLSSLEGVNEYFNLKNCPLLSDLTGLSSFKTVDFGFLEISNLPLIDNLDFLSGIENVNDEIFIRRNENLTNYCGLENLFNTNPPARGIYTEDNSYNPTTEDITNGNCQM